MTSRSFLNTIQACGFVIGEAVQTALSISPFGGIFESALRLSEKLEELQECDERATNVKMRCSMISTILLKHSQHLKGCDFILGQLASTLESG